MQALRARLIANDMNATTGICILTGNAKSEQDQPSSSSRSITSCTLSPRSGCNNSPSSALSASTSIGFRRLFEPRSSRTSAHASSGTRTACTKPDTPPEMPANERSRSLVAWSRSASVKFARMCSVLDHVSGGILVQELGSPTKAFHLSVHSIPHWYVSCHRCPARLGAETYCDLCSACPLVAVGRRNHVRH